MHFKNHKTQTVYLRKKNFKLVMKYIQKSRIETFLKTKGYNVEALESNKEETKYAYLWIKSENEKVIVPKQDIIQSTELANIFTNTDLLKEFRKY